MANSKQESQQKQAPAGELKIKRWILLRGLARGAGHWADFPEILKSKLGDVEIELLDIPGNGVFNDEKSPLSLDGYVDFLREKSSLAKKGSVGILAISLGAMIAINWATRYPNEIDGIVLSCTSSARSPFFRRLSWTQYPFVLKSFLIRDEEERERTILEMICRNHSRINQYLNEFVDYARRLPINRANVVRQLLAARRFRLPEKPKVPVLLLGAWGDQFVSPRCTLDIAEYWKVTPVMHPWGGHDLVIDDPQWLAEQAQSINGDSSRSYVEHSN